MSGIDPMKIKLNLDKYLTFLSKIDLDLQRNSYIHTF